LLISINFLAGSRRRRRVEDRFEIVAPPTRQAPVEDARRGRMREKWIHVAVNSAFTPPHAKWPKAKRGRSTKRARTIRWRVTRRFVMEKTDTTYIVDDQAAGLFHVNRRAFTDP
jgi:hypothetical protein